MASRKRKATRIAAAKSPAGRLAQIDALLNPVVWEHCEVCGSCVKRHLPPLISKEDALRLLGMDIPKGGDDGKS
jgi:hypothetical protein